MLAIRLQFPAGRYHATPWGRHVNEADLAWPPDPWRIVRAFIATWHRKLDPRRFPAAQLHALLARLAQDAPVYRLPPAVHSHVRHYMPVREGSTDKNILIFDAFARVSVAEPLIVAYPTLDLDTEQRELLDALLWAVGYLGRAESWAEAERLPSWCVEDANCLPGDTAVDPATGEMGELVPLLAPLSVAAYRVFRQEMLAGLGKRRLKPAERRSIEKTLPEDWLAALSLDTRDLQEAGWSQPPAARWVHYRRPFQALKPSAPLRVAVARPGPAADTARLALYGKPLPLVEDAVRVGEWARLAMMAQAKQLYGEDRIPSVLSGHGLPEGNRHGHAFYLPEDADDDGRIDHLLIHAPAGFDHNSLRALASVTRLWNRDGGEWHVLFEGQGTAAHFEPDCRLVKTASVWRSLTPYLHPWHRKKNFDVPAQLRRECRERGLPEPKSIDTLECIPVGDGRPRWPVHFHRFRCKRGLPQPDSRGCFLELRFSQPVRGPLAFGYGCHFGLGLFTAIDAA
ncbi:type I-G CRISPR-associated protein Csb2 [Candidatus Methylocalor cossyra]|uniref:Type I-U CRISPR-associated protein Cas5/Cas6 n=1 Tax=Candidatus Methylocalor cossyra TaxID=3108543 RepID=A0ABM9NKC3_9GAMM